MLVWTTFWQNAHGNAADVKLCTDKCVCVCVCVWGGNTFFLVFSVSEALQPTRIPCDTSSIFIKQCNVYFL